MVSTPIRGNITQESCLSRQVLDLIADKWTALVFYSLSNGCRRSAELLRTIEGISQKMLSQTLRDLEKNGLVFRSVYPTIPPAVEYGLTPLGETLKEPIHALGMWAEEHLGEVAEAREAYARRSIQPATAFHEGAP
jgi:DNA-binding HxlR family transcriptional regulator